MFPNIVSLLELSWLSNSLPFFSSCSFPGFMNSHLVHDIQSWYSNKHLRNPMQISGVLAELLFPDWFYCSIIQSFPTLRDPMDCSTWVFLVLHPSQSLLKLISIELVMTSNHLILCHLFLILPSIFPSIRVFSNESALHIRWPKYWSFSFSISPSSEYSGLISFRIDWFGILKSLLKHHNLKASILQSSTFFIVQL